VAVNATRETIVRVLRAVADALEAPAQLSPSASSAPGRRLVVEQAPPGTPAPEPFEHAPPGSDMDAANRLLARMYLIRALRRFSPTFDYHA